MGIKLLLLLIKLLLLLVKLLLLLFKLLLLLQCQKVPLTKTLAHALHPKFSHFQLQLSLLQLLAKPSKRLMKWFLLQQEKLATQLRLAQLTFDHLQLILAETKQVFICGSAHLGPLLNTKGKQKN